MINCSENGDTNKDNHLSIPNISLFEATRKFRQTNLSLQQLSKTIRILRKRQQHYGRTNKFYQEELVKQIDSKFRQTGKFTHSEKTPGRLNGVQTKNPSLHYERPSNTRQTSQRLKKALQEVRQYEARSVRDNSELNERQLRQRQMQELQSKKKKRDDIMGFEKALRESYTEFRNRRQLKTNEDKRKDITQLVDRQKQNENLIRELLVEKENLLQCMNEGTKLQLNLKLTLKKVAQSKPFPPCKFILSREQIQN